jgi:hypothetical protein
MDELKLVRVFDEEGDYLAIAYEPKGPRQKEVESEEDLDDAPEMIEEYEILFEILSQHKAQVRLDRKLMGMSRW